MKSAIFASLLAVASAFVPSKDASRSSVAVNMAFEEELGAQPPIGFFDPLGITRRNNLEDFNRLRYVEIKHGRISMLAVVGYLVTEAGIRFPGDIDYAGTKFADIPCGFDALSAMPTNGFNQILAFVGWCELFFMKEVDDSAEFPGDFRNGWIDYGWESWDEDTQYSKRGIELNNGRAAMMGILGLMVHEKLGVSILPPGAVH